MHLLSFLTSLVIPHHCLLCKNALKTKEQSICQICILAQARCSKLDLIPHERIFSTVAASFMCALINTQSAKQLCQNLKYGSNHFLAIELGHSLLGPCLQSFYQKSSKKPFLIPMPISKRRRKSRGYNQSEKLSEGCLRFIRAQGIDATSINLLNKTHHKRSQVEFGPFDRWTNPKGSIGIRKEVKQRISENALLVLIDDTVTTGSTLIHASKIIRDHFPSHPLLILSLALEV
jgi:predicted amidophosphoribosyltransferase